MTDEPTTESSTQEPAPAAPSPEAPPLPEPAVDHVYVEKGLFGGTVTTHPPQEER
jgi:hypothetical protein